MQAFLKELTDRIKYFQKALSKAQRKGIASSCIRIKASIDAYLWMLDRLQEGITLYVLTGNCSDGKRDALAVWADPSEISLTLEDVADPTDEDGVASYDDMQTIEIRYAYKPPRVPKPRKKNTLTSALPSPAAMDWMAKSFTPDQD